MADNRNAGDERQDVAHSDAHGEARAGGDQMDSVAYTCSALQPTLDLDAAVSCAESRTRSQETAQTGEGDQSLVSFIPEIVAVDFMPDGSPLLLGRSPLYAALDAIRLKSAWDEYLHSYFLHNLALD